MLLTGDARGDDTLAALDDTGLTGDDGKIHVDLLKIPHHGSLHNIDRTYYERISADHYVISADGRHHNPDHEALQMLVDSQGDRSYTIHLTNESHTASFFEADKAANNRNYAVAIRERSKHSLFVDLADPI